MDKIAVSASQILESSALRVKTVQEYGSFLGGGMTKCPSTPGRESMTGRENLLLTSNLVYQGVY